MPYAHDFREVNSVLYLTSGVVRGQPVIRAEHAGVVFPLGAVEPAVLARVMLVEA